MSEAFDELANLGSEATKTVGDALAERVKAIPATPPPAVASPTDGYGGSTPPRRRGRPPGAKNKPKEGLVPPGTVSPQLDIPGTKGRPVGTTNAKTPEQIEAENKKKADTKKARAKELESQIMVELNEQLMGLVMALGVPAQALYKPGMEPKDAPSNSPYSALGDAIAIGPMQAKTWARFAAELEATDGGGKISAAMTGDSKAPLVISGILSVATGLMYAQQLKQTMDKLAPMIQAYKQYQQTQERTKDGDNGTE